MLLQRALAPASSTEHSRPAVHDTETTMQHGTRDAAMAVAVGGRSMQPGLDILAAIMHTSCWLLYPTG